MKPVPELSTRIHRILDTAQIHAARSVNSAQVVANWLIGKEIVGEEQGGKATAAYGEKVIPELARRLKQQGVKGYSTTNLKFCRQFHLTYTSLLQGEIGHALRDQFQLPAVDEAIRINHAPRDEFQSTDNRPHFPSTDTPALPIPYGHQCHQW